MARPPFLKRSFAALGVAALTLMLCGCAATQMAGGVTDTAAGGQDALTGVFGSGPQVVGVLAFDEADNLSDGAVDSIYQSARVAAETLKGNPLTVVVRSAGVDGADLPYAMQDFDKFGVKLIIGSDVPVVAADTAKAMIAKGRPTISLTSFADMGMQLYGAAFVPGEEAAALVNEVARRGYKSVLVVTSPGRASTELSKSIMTLAAAGGVVVRPLDGSTDSQFSAGLTAMTAAGVSVDAVIFAIGPQRAAAMVDMMKSVSVLKKVAIVGNSGWAVLDPSPRSLKGAWYPSLQGNELSEYAKKLREAKAGTGTLNSALVYDLLVLAAALPQSVKEDPYHPEIMTASQGFGGFSGTFRFGPTGMLAARQYVIETVD